MAWDFNLDSLTDNLSDAASNGVKGFFGLDGSKSNTAKENANNNTANTAPSTAPISTPVLATPVNYTKWALIGGGILLGGVVLFVLLKK
jgi:hypothetical protein